MLYAGSVELLFHEPLGEIFVILLSVFRTKIKGAMGLHEKGEL